MRSSTAARLWEIWHRNRGDIAGIAAVTVAGRLIDYSEQPTDDPSSIITLLAMIAFLFLFGVFSYTEPTGIRGLGRFPRRLFIAPISSLRLVALPMLTGVASTELLYVLWLPTLSRGDTLSIPFVAVLLGALMVFFQAVLWTLESLGPLRLLVAGSVAVVVYGVGLLPSWPPSPAPLWRSEAVVGTAVTALAVIAFLGASTHIARLRRGDAQRAFSLAPLVESAAKAFPRQRTPFGSPAAAHFWFEWRSSGTVLPLLVAGVAAVVITPLSWFARNDMGSTLHVLLGALATPIVLSIPVGMAFARPAFWSDDLSLPAFVAIRPLTDEEIVAIKIKVAAASAVVAWFVVLSFVGVWFLVWAGQSAVSELARELRWGALISLVGIILTWRFLVSRLWSGLAGHKTLFAVSVMSSVLFGVGCLVFPVDQLPAWLLESPANLSAVVWVLATAVAAKCGLAVWSWRNISGRYVRQYLVVWTASTLCVLGLALATAAFQTLMILLALLAVPLARVALAPSSVTRNRHR